MFKAIVFAIVVAIATVICGSLAVLISIFNRYSPMIYGGVTRSYSKIILLAANIKAEISGMENIKPDTSYMVVSNHQSHLDIPVLVYNLPLRLTFLAKKELFKIPFFGWGMQAAGILKIDRSDRSKAIQTLKDAERIIVEKKFSVMAFPEGTRSIDGNIHEFKKGSFVMAINTGLPVLPVSIKGTYYILPKKRIKIKPGKVRVKIHKPIDSGNYTFENRHELVKKAHEIIVEGFNEN
jgi:1-acyl-sn-glycerol-3-phosphate acyltransferase